MREMTPEEIRFVLARARWASICTVSPDQKPYAVEATPYREAGDICFMINPRGRTGYHLKHNPSVLLKVTLTNRGLSWWAGVSCFGRGRFDADPDAIRRGFERLGRIMGADYAAAGDKHAARPGRSPLLRVTVAQTTGRCSARSGDPLAVNWHLPEEVPLP
jgi:nitroimidazol reductase NimA-like FMN-containing flavoprotein (pyridoxamine 5'-phosphate oxidase superfamily)